MIGLLAAVALTQGAPDLGFMAGEWIECRPDGRVVEEHWLGPVGDGALYGVTVTRSASARVSFEHARVGSDAQGWAFVAQPQGAPPTRFALVRSGPGEAVFENPDHDFPKRIAYRREGATLVARATDLDDRGPTWRYGPKADAACALSGAAPTR